jgi:hypothetical protein
MLILNSFLFIDGVIEAIDERNGAQPRVRRRCVKKTRRDSTMKLIPAETLAVYEFLLRYD